MALLQVTAGALAQVFLQTSSTSAANLESSGISWSANAAATYGLASGKSRRQETGCQKDCVSVEAPPLVCPARNSISDVDCLLIYLPNMCHTLV